MVSLENVKYKFADESPVIMVENSDLTSTLTSLHGQGLTHLSTIIGLQEDNKLSVLYPISGQVPDMGKTIFVKTQVGMDNPQLETMVGLYPIADAPIRSGPNNTPIKGIKTFYTR